MRLPPLCLILLQGCSCALEADTGDGCKDERVASLLQRQWRRSAKTTLEFEDGNESDRPVDEAWMDSYIFPIVSQEEQGEGITSMSNGSTAPFTELGYAAVAATCCNYQMEVFILRLLHDMKFDLCDSGALTAFTAFFTCEKGVRTLSALKQGISKHRQPSYPCKWFTAVGSPCPKMSASCSGEADSSYHRRRICTTTSTTSTLPSCIPSKGEVCGTADEENTMLCQCDCVACAMWKAQSSFLAVEGDAACNFQDCLEHAGTASVVETCSPGLPGAIGTCSIELEGLCKIPPLPLECGDMTALTASTTTMSPGCEKASCESENTWGTCTEKLLAEKPLATGCPAANASFLCVGSGCETPDLVHHAVDYTGRPWCLPAIDEICKKQDSTWCAGQCKRAACCPHACGRCSL